MSYASASYSSPSPLTVTVPLLLVALSALGAATAVDGMAIGGDSDHSASSSSSSSSSSAVMLRADLPQFTFDQYLSLTLDERQSLIHLLVAPPQHLQQSEEGQNNIDKKKGEDGSTQNDEKSSEKQQGDDNGTKEQSDSTDDRDDDLSIPWAWVKCSVCTVMVKNFVGGAVRHGCGRIHWATELWGGDVCNRAGLTGRRISAQSFLESLRSDKSKDNQNLKEKKHSPRHHQSTKEDVRAGSPVIHTEATLTDPLFPMCLADVIDTCETVFDGANKLSDMQSETEICKEIHWC